MSKTSHQPAKTSKTQPLVIAEVRHATGAGRIGITLCPGKKQHSSFSGLWNRDLDMDLDLIRDWGASAVVTLVEEHELQSLSVVQMGEGVQDRNMAWYHLPIVDVSTPDNTFETSWETVGEQLRSRLRNGFDILVHCKGGLGRAGTIAGKLLAELGVPAKEAIAAVRAVRPGAIETDAQERYVLAQQPVAAPRLSREAEAIVDRALGALVGLAVGDAIGTTLEFRARDSYSLLCDMIGGGPFSLEAGQWTDDTAMALALADSLAACGGIDEIDLMERFTDWRENGTYSCTGVCFDIGLTTGAAIDRWQDTGNPIAGSTDPSTAGNGSLMRLAPVALRYWQDRDALRDAAQRQSRTTHAAPAAVSACSTYAEMLADAISGHSLDKVLSRLEAKSGRIANADISRVAAGSWRGRPRDDIRGSGYVVESMEAAIWSVARSGSFAEAVLTAANLGDDADTTAAIAGQLAGALYGLSGIPDKWFQQLAWGQRIVDVARKLSSASVLSPVGAE